MSEVEVGGRRFDIGRMPPLEQFHVMRRLAPVLRSIAGLAALSPETDRELSSEEQAVAGRALSDMVEAISTMPDEALNYVISRCLARVRLRQEPHNTLAPIWVAGQLAFDDIDWAMMIRLVIEVVRENLGSFSSGLLPGSLPQSPPT